MAISCRFVWTLALAASFGFGLGLANTSRVARAEEAKAGDKGGEKSVEKSDSKQAKTDAASESSDSSNSKGDDEKSKSSSSSETKSKYRPYAEVMKEADAIPGLIKLDHKGGTVYAEISPSQLNKDFIVVISIAKGIGRG